MTNAQKWVTAVLVLFIGLFLLSKLFQSDDTVVPEDVDKYVQQDTEETTAEVTGLTLIQQNGCTSCHGDNLKGIAKLGPDLYNAKKHWNRDGLINYLRNPADYRNDKRFDEYKDEFSNIMMPSFENLSVQDLGKIADYVLNLKAE